ncbi:MAG: radical SAM protein [Spirochaetales bacterium]|nr:radical SAM protein [Spirochaetales bacterium]
MDEQQVKESQELKDFPNIVSLTVTNRCNLRCRMCAQWSEEGYIRGNKSMDSYSGEVVSFENLLKVVDEIHEHKAFLLIRGGEPLLYPRIVDLLAHIKSKDMPLSFETNGVLLKNFAESFVELKVDHLTISLDGPEEVHDLVRGVKGTFARLRESLKEIEKYENKYGFKIDKSITCTVSGDNYRTLGAVPDVARELGFKTLCVVPYYFIPEKQGLAYEKLMQEEFSCKAYSWRGFHHEESGVDVEQFIEQLNEFKSNLGDLYSYPYMALTDEEYREWYSKSDTSVRQAMCQNIWGLLDVQPDGNVNFCVDFPDYVIGNVVESTLHQLWHSERAWKFRELRTKMEMPVCYRCGAKYMG